MRTYHSSFFFSSRRRHTRCDCDWSSDVCSSDLAIANGGLLVRPYLVRRVLTPEGDVVLANEPAVVRRVVSARTAATVTALLRRAVEEKGGTGEKARLDDFPVAGKTGTAQKVNLHTGTYSSKRIGSFVGFVPADRPRVVILVLI